MTNMILVYRLAGIRRGRGIVFESHQFLYSLHFNHAMIEGISPLYQSTLGTLFTWSLTALGAGLVFVFKSGKVSILTLGIYFFQVNQSKVLFKSLHQSMCLYVEHMLQP